MSKIHACAVIFGDGTSDFREAALRLQRQLVEQCIFETIKVFDYEKLIRESKKFNEDSWMLQKLDRFPLYFRAVKPWLVLHVMENLNPKAEVILYIDAGCEVTNNAISRRRMTKLLKTAADFGGVAEETTYSESEFTKRALLEFFPHHLSARNVNQVQDTWFMLRNDDQSKSLLERWIELSHPNRGFWQDPDESELRQQYPEFRAHRHDQSIFSLLYKDFNLPTRELECGYLGKFGAIRGLPTPIQGSRNRTGVTKLPFYHRSKVLAFIGEFLNLLAKLSRSIFS